MAVRASPKPATSLLAPATDADRQGRRHAQRTAAAPMARSSVAPTAPTASKLRTAMAAPAYCDTAPPTKRTAAQGARPDVAYVLVFENRGPAVGATVPHPHGQLYAFPSVPEAPARELS